MPFNPQNLLKRAQAGGFSIDNAVSELKNAAPNLQKAANIDINGTLSGVTSQAQGALDSAVQKLAGKVRLPSGLDLIGLTGGLNLAGMGIGAGGGESAVTELGGELPFKNQLEKFASFNYIFTLGCLNAEEVNFPDLTYRYNDPEVLVLKSGGGAGPKKTRTVYETAGAVEYFIDDVEIKTIIAPAADTKQTNATAINFKVLEPYSMGMFLQTLNLAAKEAGHENYIGAPYVLSVEFVGFDDNGNYMRPPKARRIFPLNFVNVTFNVTEGGSMYDVQAIPWHESALSDQIQSVKTDISLTGTTVGELLQSGPGSLSTVLNDREVRQEQADQVKRGDQYVIAFPQELSSVTDVLLGSIDNEQGATTKSKLSQAGEEIREFTESQKENALKLAFGGNQVDDMLEIAEQELQKVKGFVMKRSEFGEKIRNNAENELNLNDIGKSKIVKSYLDGGEVPFGRPKFTEVKDKPGVFSRGSLSISDEGRKFTFKQGTKIQDIIEETLIISDYGRKLAESAETPDANGMVDWFKIEANIYLVDDPGNINRTGKYPKVYVYQVIPYKVHVSKMANRNTATPGMENIRNETCKEYNYIYTGANKDILDFNIDINYAFFMGLPADKGQLGADEKLAGQNQSASGNKSQPSKASEGGNANSQAGISPTMDTTGAKNASGGGGGQSHVANQVARSYNEAIVNSDVDLVMVDLKVMGDPYYIADSGMGNYNAEADPASINLTKDGTIEYQRSEVDVTLNFRTPIDTGETWMEFPGLGTQPVGAFSGVYQVLFVTNNFSGGEFTQDLRLMRRPNQTTDTTAKPTSKGNGAITDGDEKNNMNESSDLPSGHPERNKGTTGGGTSQTKTPVNNTGYYADDASASTQGSKNKSGSKPKPESNKVINRIRGTL
jgi:hypothetical protein